MQEECVSFPLFIVVPPSASGLPLLGIRAATYLSTLKASLTNCCRECGRSFRAANLCETRRPYRSRMPDWAKHRNQELTSSEFGFAEIASRSPSGPKATSPHVRWHVG